MGSDTRIEKIKDWIVGQYNAHLGECPEVPIGVQYCRILLSEIDQGRDRLKDAEEYGEEYIDRTDPALQCDYWWRYDDNYWEPGERCESCRRCALEEVDRLKAERQRIVVDLKALKNNNEHDDGPTYDTVVAADRA